MSTDATPAPRYWAVTDAEGQIALDDAQVEVYADRDYAVNSCRYYGGKCGLEEVAIIPHADYTRLLAIEAAARNALDNSWEIEQSAEDCACEDWRGCTVLDPKDAKELREAYDKVRDVMECDFQRLRNIIDTAPPAATGEKEIEG